MDQNQPSRTALGAALHRAAHQLVDTPPVFVDPLAVRIVGGETEHVLAYAQEDEAARAGLRAFIAARSRFTEDCLAEACDRGVRQYVLLGAGLDTFAYRSSARFPGLRVFEVDHPATQGWKRERLAAAGISIPPSLTYVPVDFDREILSERLAHAGFEALAPALFAWLGVTPYLTSESVLATLSWVAGLTRERRSSSTTDSPPEPAAPSSSVPTPSSLRTWQLSASRSRAPSNRTHS